MAVNQPESEGVARGQGENDRIGAARLSVWPSFLISLSTVLELEKGTALTSSVSLS